MTRPLAAAALLAGVLAILNTTSWAQQPDSAQQLDATEEAVDTSEATRVRVRSLPQVDFEKAKRYEAPSSQRARQPRHNDPFGPSTVGSAGQGYSTMAPPGTYHPVSVLDHLVVVDTRNGKSYKFASGVWHDHSPPVRPAAGELPEEKELRLRSYEEQLKNRVKELQQHLNDVQQQLIEVQSVRQSR